MKNGRKTLRARVGLAAAAATAGAAFGDDADIHPRQKFVVGARAADVIVALRGAGGVEDGVVARIAAADARALTLDFFPPLAPDATSASGASGAAAASVAGFVLCDSAAARCAARAVRSGSRVEVAGDALPRSGSAALLLVRRRALRRRGRERPARELVRAAAAAGRPLIGGGRYFPCFFAAGGRLGRTEADVNFS